MAESSRPGSFLWSDRAPDRIRLLHDGEILVEPIGENPKPVPRGLVHHWIGALFLPGISVNAVLAVVRDYNRYEEFYAPNVIGSKVMRHAGTEDAFSLRMLNKAIFSKFALDAEFQTSYVRLDERRWYSVGRTTSIREVEQYGRSGEYELPPDCGRGFIWRLYNIARFEQRDGGVYVELEAVALSRDVPTGLRWVVNPVVRRTSRDSIFISLQKTQQAVLAPRELATVRASRDQSGQKRSASATPSRTEVDKAFTPRKTF